MNRLVLALLVTLPIPLALAAPLKRERKPAPADPFVWLEEVEGEKALTWVAEQNAASHDELTQHDVFAEIETDTLAILEADDRIIVGRRRGEFVYHVWRDAKNPRGIFRRTPLAAYLAGTPEWDVLLDVDALAASEDKNWVWKGIDVRRPDHARALVRLSIGGSDAVVVREFDLPSKSFVEGGFELPESKGSRGWIDADTIFVATEFADGTLTDSGYPRIVKRWKRGTPLADAELVFEGKRESVSVGARHVDYGETALDWVWHGTSFYESEEYLVDGDGLTLVDVPRSAEIHTVFDRQLIVELNRDWEVDGTTYPKGSVLALSLADLRAGKKTISVFFTPDESTSLQGIERTKSYLLVRVMKDVRDELYRYERKDGAWSGDEIEFDGLGTIWTSSVDVDHDDFFVGFGSFLRPTTLFHVDAATLEKKVIDQAPQRFDPDPYTSAQMFATSRDGTRIPYFIVHSKDLEKNGKNRTLLYGYGGFRISQRPRYLGATGKNWLARGGVYVVANIRGGGEYGPRWHDAALKQHRHKAYEDFEAIAEDLIAKKITSPTHLGIQGGSNGGLLVGAAFTRRPDLYGAVVCAVPLLDMRRFNKLLAGASWMGEYGNPDIPEEWAFIQTYSPYHNLSPLKRYPRVLFTTSTRDDRVHPAHARKMVALMRSMDHPVLYYENTEGGHAGAANAKQRAYKAALTMTYLLTELGQ